MNNYNPKLTIVGAGPGDPELITLKAIKTIQSANVILYDALVNVALLEYASPQAELIYVGKRKGLWSYKQEKINDLIVEKVKKKGHVVRLKGGDPLVFGRGAEEMDYARSHDIEVAMVAGISSALSVPASLGIPMTKRGAAESFWVITGTTKSHKISTDIAIAAKSTATIVILMGMGKLSEIVEIFQAENKGSSAVAIIQNGTRADEKSVIGTIDSIEKEVRIHAIGTPAIIIIGEVVNQRAELGAINNYLAKRSA